MTTICKRCLLSETNQDDVYQAVHAAIGCIPPNKKTSPPEYERRLALCRNCDSLVSGTCLQCGCYVELRAAEKTSRCPAKDSKW